jgi:hypothetical protein
VLSHCLGITNVETIQKSSHEIVWKLNNDRQRLFMYKQSVSWLEVTSTLIASHGSPVSLLGSGGLEQVAELGQAPAAGGADTAYREP